VLQELHEPRGRGVMRAKASVTGISLYACILSRSMSVFSLRIRFLSLSHCFFFVLFDSFEERTNTRKGPPTFGAVTRLLLPFILPLAAHSRICHYAVGLTIGKTSGTRITFNIRHHLTRGWILGLIFRLLGIRYRIGN
jgi:hypothetical protein